MRKLRSTRLCLLLVLALLFSSVVSATGSFVATSDGIRYVIKDNSGKITQVVTPKYDTESGKYYVKTTSNKVIYQSLLPEAAMEEFKFVTPVSGNGGTQTKSTDFLGNKVPLLQSLPINDPRHQQLTSYIENNSGLKQVVGMHVEARNMKIAEIQKDLTAGTKDPALAQWLVNDLKKPIYLEINDSGGIYHDPRGFILTGETGEQSVYVDNSKVNRIAISADSEVFNGGMSDPSAASVIAHEVGHMMMDQLYESPNYPATNYAGPHSKNSVTDEGFAISEGWAEAVEAISTREYHNNDTDSWRIQTHKNIAENNYIFENQDVVDVANDGILKSANDMLSTEGVNASLFYDVLTDNSIQNSYQKTCTVFESAKPQTYREFIEAFIEQYPEDRSTMIEQFLDNTKYATVDGSAGNRYKEVHDAQQAWENSTDPLAKDQLKTAYDTKLDEYNNTNEELYKRAVVEGKIDGAVSGADYSDSDYSSVRLSETLIKSQKALGQGFQNAADSIKSSFSVKNLAMTAGTSIAINLASQLMNGEKVSVKSAVQAVASMQFVGNVVGSSLGAAVGQVFVPLIQTFIPIPIVGAIAGTILPAITSLVGGNLGGSLGSGMSFKSALQSIDLVALSGQAIGSTLGAMLGSMIPIPVVGTMIGSMLGGILGEKLFTGIAKLFGRDKEKNKSDTFQAYESQSQPMANIQVSDRFTAPTASLRLTPEIDKIPYNKMHPNLQKVKDLYEESYKSYVSAISSGDQALAQKELKNFQAIKERYQRVLGAYTK